MFPIVDWPQEDLGSFGSTAGFSELVKIIKR